MKEWTCLFIAGIFEIVWAVGLKYTEGITKIIPVTITAVAMILSIYFLAQAVKILPFGTAYAVWTGIGIAGTFIIGIVFFNESRDLLRILCVLLIFSGVIGLKLTHGK
jgi:quaternary ammonium compound-resistance protein SugE